jgi:hypothetical protein
MGYRSGMCSRRMLAIPTEALRLLCLLVASGCAQWIGIEDLPEITDGSSPPGDPPDASTGVLDADPDRPDAVPCVWTYMPRHVDPCAAGKPPQDTDVFLPPFVPLVYDTTTGELTGLELAEGLTTERSWCAHALGRGLRGTSRRDAARDG